jgi:valyl-tRNA synthetase
MTTLLQYLKEFPDHFLYQPEVLEIFNAAQQEEPDSIAVEAFVKITEVLIYCTYSSKHQEFKELVKAIKSAYITLKERESIPIDLLFEANDPNFLDKFNNLIEHFHAGYVTNQYGYTDGVFKVSLRRF